MSVVLSGERCREERRVAPDRVLPTDKEVETGVDCKCRDVLDKLFLLDVLFAELMQRLKSVQVLPRKHASRPHFKGADVRLQLRDVR